MSEDLKLHIVLENAWGCQGHRDRRVGETCRVTCEACRISASHILVPGNVRKGQEVAGPLACARSSRGAMEPGAGGIGVSEGVGASEGVCTCPPPTHTHTSPAESWGSEESLSALEPSLPHTVAPRVLS